MVKEYNYLSCLSIILDNKNPKVKELALEAGLKVLESGDKLSPSPYVDLFITSGLDKKIKIFSNNESDIMLVNDIKKYFKTEEVHELQVKPTESAQSPQKMPPVCQNSYELIKKGDDSTNIDKKEEKEEKEEEEEEEGEEEEEEQEEEEEEEIESDSEAEVIFEDPNRED